MRNISLKPWFHWWVKPACRCGFGGLEHNSIEMIHCKTGALMCRQVTLLQKTKGMSQLPYLWMTSAKWLSSIALTAGWSFLIMFNKRETMPFMAASNCSSEKDHVRLCVCVWPVWGVETLVHFLKVYLFLIHWACIKQILQWFCEFSKCHELNLFIISCRNCSAILLCQTQ